MKIKILLNSIANEVALKKGISDAINLCKNIGLNLEITYEKIDKTFSSIPITSDVVKSSFGVNPQEILPYGTGFEILVLMSSWTKVQPNNWSTNNPINTCTWDLDKTTLNNTIVMEIMEEWYNQFPEVLTQFFTHELCHAVWDKTNGSTPDLTHFQYANANYSQKQPIDYYLFLLKELTTKLKPIVNSLTTYKYFKPSEIVGLKPELVAMLDKARGVAGVAFKITSGFRTPEQNKLVGGVQDSSHELGLAVDLAVPDSVTGGKILLALAQVGFQRFGFYNDGHLHCDIDTSKPSPCYWIK